MWSGHRLNAAAPVSRRNSIVTSIAQVVSVESRIEIEFPETARPFGEKLASTISADMVNASTGQKCCQKCLIKNKIKEHSV